MGIRLLADAGASFALLPVPDLAQPTHREGTQLMDVELLSPDRLVRYLAREVSTGFLEKLAESWMRCAQEASPEQAIPTVEDRTAGIAALVAASTPFSVTLEFLVTSDLEADVLEHDGISFEVARTSLIDAAHILQGWLA